VGGFQSQPNLPTFGPENVWTYEVGTKASLLNDQLTFDADLFYSNFDNYQIDGVTLATINGIQQALDIYSNGGTARIDGIEWNVAWRSTEEWMLRTSGNYFNDYNFTKVPPAKTFYLVGDTLDGVSQYEFTLSAERDFRWRDKPGYVRLDYQQQGPQTYRLRSLDSGTFHYLGETSTIHMLNFNSGLQWSQGLKMSFFVQNLLNDRNFTAPYYIEGDSARNRPRTFGVQFGVNFD
jgi:iron complex outermembrane receptor protein